MSTNTGRQGRRWTPGIAAAVALLALAAGVGTAQAQGVRGEVGRERAAAGLPPARSGRPPVQALPPGYRTYRYGGHPYYFGGGRWYAPGYGGYGWIAPPIGLSIDVLPLGYSTVWVGGAPYYYYDDVYYAWRPGLRSYVVVEPPAGVSEARASTTADDLYVYPKNGQSEAQQSTDRYECHSWAKGQTGFDPTEPAGGVAMSDTAGRRAEYRRAMTACLQGRGYSVN